MSFRIFEGHVLSAEGWRMCNADECVWVKIPGKEDVSIQVRSGIPATILPAFIARYNNIVEQVRDRDTACWTLTNSVSTSNHPAGVACDINWELHPFHAYNTFGDRLGLLRQVQDEFRGCIQWGGDWGGNPQDEMHHELNYPEGYLDKNGNFVLDVDKRLIDLANDLRAGYLGIYVPGQTPAPLPLSREDRYAHATIAEGQRLGITRRGIIIALAVELVETNLTMYANSNDPASLDLPHDKVGSDHMSSGLFQQQTAWGPLADRMDPTRSATIFFTVDHGPGVRGLTKIRDGDGKLYDYNSDAHSMGFYAQKVQGSAFPDRYDERMADATALYDRLATPSSGDDELSAEDSAKIDAIYQELTKLFVSRSPFRPLDAQPQDTIDGFDLFTNGSVDFLALNEAAKLGHPPSMKRLASIANTDLTKHPDRKDDADLAQAILAEATTPVPVAVAPSGAPTPQVVYYPAPVSSAPSTPSSTGQLIGLLYDALEAVKSAQVSLSPEAQASIDSLISVLKPTVATS